MVNESTGKDQISQWIAPNLKDPAKVSPSHIVGHGMSNILAGSDTTGIQFRSVFYYLLRNPEKMTRLVGEIDSANRNGKLSRPITYKEASSHLPYLQAVFERIAAHSPKPCGTP